MWLGDQGRLSIQLLRSPEGRLKLAKRLVIRAFNDSLSQLRRWSSYGGDLL